MPADPDAEPEADAVVEPEVEPEADAVVEPEADAEADAVVEPESSMPTTSRSSNPMSKLRSSTDEADAVVEPVGVHALELER